MENNLMFWKYCLLFLLIRYSQQTSCLQQLEQGKLYYIEALHSNYVENDHVRIHVKFPGSNTTRSLDKEYLFLYSPGKDNWLSTAMQISVNGVLFNCIWMKQDKQGMADWNVLQKINKSWTLSQISFAVAKLKALLESQSRNEIFLRKQSFCSWTIFSCISTYETFRCINHDQFQFLTAHVESTLKYCLLIFHLFYFLVFTYLYPQAPRCRPPVFYWDAAVSLVAGDWKHLSLQKKTIAIAHASSMKAQTVCLISKFYSLRAYIVHIVPFYTFPENIVQHTHT